MDPSATFSDDNMATLDTGHWSRYVSQQHELRLDTACNQLRELTTTVENLQHQLATQTDRTYALERKIEELEANIPKKKRRLRGKQHYQP